MDESAADSTAAPPQRRQAVPLKVKAALALLFGGVLGLSLYTASYAEGLSYLSDDPVSCTNCHVMNDVYDAWVKGPHHAVATCNDCHIPHQLPDKYAVKALNGWNHSWAFTTGEFHEPIRITGLNRRVTQAACRGCHGEIVAAIDAVPAAHSGPLDCIECHRDVGHLH